MPFDTAEVARQIEVSRAAVRHQEQARADALQMALRIYHEVGETAWEERVRDSSLRRWAALPLTALDRTTRHDPGAPDYCVVATDSSFVPPDKHRGAFCHLINVGRVMIRYGDTRAAEIDSVPNHYAELLQEGEELVAKRVLSARCALREMEELYAWAEQYGADVALVDGSLMQLPLVLSKEAETVELTRKYFGLIEKFRQLRIPVIGYISQPASVMVMRSIRMLGCEQPLPCEDFPVEGCSCTPLWSVDDADLFWEILDGGHLSPMFEPTFSNLKGGSAEEFKGLVFSYLATPHELVRLEYPRWLADEGLLAKATRIALHQCWLGKGYPNALTLAHGHAVLHNSDREAYYFLLERAGLMRKTTEKAHGKRMIGQAI